MYFKKLNIGEKSNNACHKPEAHLARRKRHAAALVIALAACGVTAFSSHVLRADVLLVDVVAVADGVRASELKGKAVYNQSNEHIGSLDDLIIGKDRVLFAILQVGGFLGLGSHYVAVPYDALQIGGAPLKVVLPNATKKELKSLPEFEYRG
jgi:hypothetical protein